MKILIVVDVARPAEPDENFTVRSLKDEDKPTEADVLCCLKRLGHDVETLAVYDNVTAIVEKLKSSAPDVVFNLSESFYHDRAHEPNIPALLELMNVRYTGSGPDALLLCKDHTERRKLAREARDRDWSVRETERQAKEAQGRAKEPRGRRQVVIHPDLADLLATAEDALSAALGREVKVSSTGGRCKVEFQLEDAREAVELAARIGGREHSRAA